MKVKNLSKVLALMVAVVMIFAALPIMANADNTADAFVVSYAAPAIPMDVNTKVDLKTLAVEIAAGTTVSGAECDWATEETDGIVLDATKKTVEALAVGNYKLTATVNGTPKNVWVIVRAEGETNFYLVNFSPLNQNTFNVDDWRGFATKSSKVTPNLSNIVLKSTHIQTENNTNSNKGGCFIYIDEIFEDFADYTVVAKMSSFGARSAGVTDVGAGVIGRANITSDNKYQSGIVTYIKQNNVTAVLKAANNDYSAYTSTVGTQTPGTSTCEKAEGGFIWNYINDYNEVKCVYSGQITKVYYEDILFLDSTTKSGFISESQTQAGYPGVVSYGSVSNVKDFKVYLNSNDKPAVMTEEEPAPEAKITITGEGTATVEAAVGAENQYTLTLAPATGYKVKLGSVVINGKEVQGAGDTGRVYTFKTEDLGNTTISVEYIKDNGQFNTVMLGAQVNLDKSGIRFGARTDAIKRAAQGVNAGLLDNRICVGDTTYAIAEIGMILIPTQLIDGELTVNSKYVVRQAVSTIVGVTDDYSDIAISLINIPEAQYGIQISSRMYISYVDGEGVTQYIYTDTIARSYNDVLDAMGK